jgi:hypothetical protein
MCIYLRFHSAIIRIEGASIGELASTPPAEGKTVDSEFLRGYLPTYSNFKSTAQAHSESIGQSCRLRSS